MNTYTEGLQRAISFEGIQKGISAHSLIHMNIEMTSMCPQFQSLSYALEIQ